jgi:L-rhamnose mutarotase
MQFWTDIKPPQGLALIKFPDGFDADMSYQLRERNSATLEDMQKSAVSVEANLLARRARQRTERRVMIKEEPSTSSSDAKLDSLARAMERMMERLTIAERNPPRENQAAPQIQNPNFRRNPTQIRQRDPRDQREQRGPDQQIRPPLQENYTDEGEEIIEELDDTHINLMGVHDDESIFLTQEEQELFLLSQTEVNEEAEETEQQAFENSIMEVHRQYNLRSKKMNENPPKKATETKKIVETKKTSESSTKKVPERSNVESPAKRNPTILQRSNQTEVSSTSQPSASAQKTMVDKSEMQSLSKASTTFSLEGELAKLKIPIPLSELMSKNAYRS